MDSSPTPFGRGRGQQRPPSAEPLTQFQALELKNALWDAQQMISRMQMELESLVATSRDHDRALTHHDNEIHALKAAAASVPATAGTGPVTPESVVEPDMRTRGEAWEQIVAGMTVYVSQGVTGAELIDVIDAAAGELFRRAGLDAGLEGIRL